MKKASALIFVLLFNFSSICFSQESYLRHYSTKEGLPSLETYSAYQDKKGYIWIASDMGVSRFDGYNFQVFNTANGLTDNTVFKFYEDHAGRIWFCTFSGRLCYYQNDSIYGKDFKVNDKIRSFLGTSLLTGLFMDDKDTLYAGSYSGLFRLIPEYKNGNTVWNEMEILNREKTIIIREGYITLGVPGSDTTLVTEFRRGRSPVKMKLPRGYQGFNTLVQSTGESVMLLYRGVSFFIDTSGAVQQLNISGDVVGGLQENDSVIWFGLKLSKARYSGAYRFLRNKPSQPTMRLLQGSSVTDILKDKEGGYWFTTLEDGLFYLPSDKFIYSNVDASLKLPETSIHLIGRNEIMFILNDTIYRYRNPENQQKELFLSENISRMLLPNTKIFNIYRSHDGQIWISSTNGIYITDSVGTKIIAHISLEHGTPPKRITDLKQVIEENDTNILSLSNTAVTRIERQLKKVLGTFQVPSRTESICMDYNGNALVATLNGLYSLSNDSIIYWGDKSALFKNRFVDLKRAGGKIVGATRGAGVVIIDDDSIYQVTMANGLLSNLCRSEFVDDQNIIWVSTNNGLNSLSLSYHPFTVKVSSYTTVDGLLSNDNNQVLRCGKMVWLLSTKGITVFDPDQAITNQVSPDIYITKVGLNNIFSPPGKIKSFDYGTNFFEINFVGLTYKDAGKQIYKYKLEGYDSTVHYTRNTSVQFTKLPSGDYRFIVSCINNSGKESTKPAVFPFSVNAPFYQKWWFSISVFAIIVFLSAFVSSLVVRRLRKNEVRKTEMNRRIANMELQALRAQMNPHFIFNCLNAIQDFITKNDTTSAKRYLTNFSKLIRSTLDNSRKQNVKLGEEINFLHLYIGLEKMRFSNRFDYKIIVQPEVTNLDIEIPSMILQPFIENSIRHGKIGNLEKQGELTITFSIKDNILICKIDDNGIGYNQSLKMKSEQVSPVNTHALHIMNERIRTIKQISQSDIRYTITDKSDGGSAGQGTEVTIYIVVDHFG